MTSDYMSVRKFMSSKVQPECFAIEHLVKTDPMNCHSPPCKEHSILP